METKIIKQDQRYKADHGWLQSYHLFSFAEYYDPNNIEFGNLRVFNDDYIAPHSGFPMHPHRNMEIITIVLQGAVSHGDTMGNVSKTQAGEVQRMSAGTGLMHSEENKEDEELHLYQIWIEPIQKGIAPSYEQKDFSNIENNKLVPLASNTGENGSLKIQSDASIFRSFLNHNQSLIHENKTGRGTFIYITSGEVSINKTTLQTEDQIRIQEKGKLKIEANTDSQFILIDVKL